MSRNFSLCIGGMSIPVKVTKSTDPRLGLKRGAKDSDGDLVPVKMVNVVTKDGAAASSKKDIDKVVSFGETVSMFEVEKGKYVEVDRKAVKAAVAKPTTNIDCWDVVRKKQITFDMIEGTHYFIDLPKDKKTKKVLDDQRIVYTILYDLLKKKKWAIIGDFCMTDLMKYIVIYPDTDSKCLKMSVLIYNDLQREPCSSPLVSSDKCKPYKEAMENILNEMRVKEIDHTKLDDKYSKQLRKVIEAQAKGKKIKVPKEHKPDTSTGLLLQLKKISASSGPKKKK